MLITGSPFNRINAFVSAQAQDFVLSLDSRNGTAPQSDLDRYRLSGVGSVGCVAQELRFERCPRDVARGNGGGVRSRPAFPGHFH